MTVEVTEPMAVETDRARRLHAHLRLPLHRNAYALVASTFATSGLGFFYWAFAAHFYDASDVGVNASLLTSMMFLTNLASLNFTDVLNRFVPVGRERTGRLVRGSYAIALGLGGASALVFVLGLSVWGKDFTDILHNRLLLGWFVAATMLWVVFVLQDAVLIGLRRSTIVLGENAIYGVAKIALLVALASVAPHSGIFLSWTAPLLLIVVVVNVLLFGRFLPEHAKDKTVVGEEVQRAHVTKFLIADYGAALLWSGTIALLPVLVLVTEGKSASAYVYIPWTICYTLYLVARNMGMALTTEGARDPSKL